MAERPTRSADQELRLVTQLSRDIVGRASGPPRSGSRRAAELRELRSTSGGGGRTRAALLDMVANDTLLLVANITLLIEGVADCLEIAGTRDNAVNYPSLSATIRPAVEMAGQVVWLLEDAIDGEERCRRYLVWRLNDLRHQRNILKDFRSSEDAATALAEVEALEKELLAQVAGARWDARPTEILPSGDVRAAALLDRTSKKPELLPKITELVRLLSSAKSVYALLSMSAHGQRIGLMYGAKQTPTSLRDGKAELLVGGFGLPPNLCIQLACVAVDIPSRLIAGWNKVSAGELHTQVVRLMKLASGD